MIKRFVWNLFSFATILWYNYSTTANIVLVSMEISGWNRLQSPKSQEQPSVSRKLLILLKETKKQKQKTKNKKKRVRLKCKKTNYSGFRTKTAKFLKSKVLMRRLKIQGNISIPPQTTCSIFLSKSDNIIPIFLLFFSVLFISEQILR